MEEVEEFMFLSWRAYSPEEWYTLADQQVLRWSLTVLTFDLLAGCGWDPCFNL